MLPKESQRKFLFALYAVYLNSAGKYKAMPKEIAEAVKSPESLSVWEKAETDEDVEGILKMVAAGKNVELKPLGVAMKNLLMSQDLFGPAFYDLISKFARYFRTGSESAAKAIQARSTSSIFPDWIRTAFKAKEIDQGGVQSEMEKFVKSVIGKSAPGLTAPQAQKLREKDVEKYRQYLKLRKEFQLAWKNTAANYVRENGNPLVKMEDLEAHLDSLGLTYSIPKGFTGQVNADLEWYDNDGNRIAGVPSAHMYPTVVMNTNRKPGGYIFTAMPAVSSAKPKYFYLAKELLERRNKKFQAVKDVVPVIDHARKVWLSGIRHFDLEDDKTVAAVAIELSYQFASRIGTEGNETKGQSTYGLATCLMKHLKFQGTNGFTLTYPGKDNIKTSHRFVAKTAEDRMVLDAVKQLADGKEPTEPIFTVGTGEDRKPLRPAVVNMVFRKLIGTKALSIHKIRTLRGTVTFSKQLEDFLRANKGKELTERQAMQQLRLMATEVGKQLNHVRTAADGEEKVTPDTALKNYIDPSVQARLFDAFALPYPKYLLKAMGKHRLESSVITAEGEDPSVEELEDELGDDAFETPSEDDAVESEPMDPVESEETPTEEPVEPEPSEEESPADVIEPEPEEAPEEKPKKDKKDKEEEPEEEEEPKKEEEEDPAETMDEARKAAEETAEEDSALLRSILLEPANADNN